MAGVDADPDVHGRAAAAAQMRAENPKYVPREWMLVEAYKVRGFLPRFPVSLLF